MTSHRIPSTQSKAEKEAAAHIETDSEMRQGGKDADDKRDSASLEEKAKLEKELEDRDQNGR